MANFDDQVMGVTGLTISGSSTAPSQSELSTFLNDGVIDVTNRSIAVNPLTKNDFLRESAEQTSDGFNPGVSEIVAVLREGGVNGDYRNCTIIPAGLQSRVTDSTSFFYKSKYNPGYMVTQNRNVHVFPAASGSGTDAYKVLYVNSSPEETDGTALIHSSSGIKWFPNNKVYLVVIYAAIKSLDSAMAAIVKPTVGGVTEELTTTMDADSSGTGTEADFLNFSKWFSVAAEYIEDEEDTELAGAQIQKISTYLQAYKSQLDASTSEYKWMQVRRSVLEGQYNQAFGIMAPKQKRRQGER